MLALLIALPGAAAFTLLSAAVARATADKLDAKRAERGLKKALGNARLRAEVGLCEEEANQEREESTLSWLDVGDERLLVTGPEERKISALVRGQEWERLAAVLHGVLVDQPRRARLVNMGQSGL